MKLLSDIIIYSIIFTTLAAAVINSKPESEPVFKTAEVKIGNNEIKLAHSRGGAIGVSSIAGISTRNGRVSSFSGVYSYPGMDSPMVIASGDAGDILGPATKYTNVKSNTSTITKTFDNKYASGTVNISPGSVSVTSFSKAGPTPEFGSYRPMPLIPVNPIITNPYIQRPFTMFEPKYYNPWLKNNAYKNTVPSNVDNLTPPWFPPRFYPFLNYWP